MILIHLTTLWARIRDDRGTALAEWALLVVLIAIVALVGVSISGKEVSTQYSNIASAVGG